MSKRHHIMYSGSESDLKKIREYVKEEFEDDIILTPIYENEGHSLLSLYLRVEQIPLVCTCIGLYFADNKRAELLVHDVTNDNMVNLYNMLPMYVGVIDNDIGD